MRPASSLPRGANRTIRGELSDVQLTGSTNITNNILMHRFAWCAAVSQFSWAFRIQEGPLSPNIFCWRRTANRQHESLFRRSPCVGFASGRTSTFGETLVWRSCKRLVHPNRLTDLNSKFATLKLHCQIATFHLHASSSIKKCRPSAADWLSTFELKLETLSNERTIAAFKQTNRRGSL